MLVQATEPCTQAHWEKVGVAWVRTPRETRNCRGTGEDKPCPVFSLHHVVSLYVLSMVSETFCYIQPVGLFDSNIVFFFFKVGLRII